MFRINLQRFVTINPSITLNTKNNKFLSDFLLYSRIYQFPPTRWLNQRFKKKKISTKERNWSNDNLNRKRNPPAKSIHPPRLSPQKYHKFPNQPKRSPAPDRPITLSTISPRSISLRAIIPSPRTTQCISNKQFEQRSTVHTRFLSSPSHKNLNYLG